MVLGRLNTDELFELAFDILVSSKSIAAVWLSTILFLFWRFWRFSLRPILHPQEPKEYPYWIPYLGHLFPFLKNSEALLTAARKYFGQHDHVFTITLAGKKAYVVTNPRLVEQIFNNTNDLSFDAFLHDIMIEFGTSEDGIRSILEVPTHGTKKSISRIAHDLQVRQTQGDELRLLGKHTIETFRELLSNDSASSLGDDVTYQETTNSAARIVWLKTWTADCFITAGQRAYFGRLLEAIDPALPSALMKMDDLSWQVFYRYPKICRPRLQKLCDQILAALHRYLKSPLAERECPAWFTLKLEQHYRTAGLSEEDIATQLLFLYWGINTNISKVGFWIIVYLLDNPGAVKQIREETSSAFHVDGTIDTDFIYRSCPVLTAIWLEALRVSAASTVLRTITQDFVLGDKLLRKGNQVLISARQLHLREQELGENIHQVDHQRFLRNPALEKSSAFRPFGGGPTICPGRLLAKYMTLNFVALVFQQFDLALDGPQKSPRYEEWKPSIGIMGGEGDLRIKLTPR